MFVVNNFHSLIQIILFTSVQNTGMCDVNDYVLFSKQVKINGITAPKNNNIIRNLTTLGTVLGDLYNV